MKRFFAALLLFACSIAHAQFAPGQVLTAAQLNNQFALYLPLSGGAMTGPITTYNGIPTVANGIAAIYAKADVTAQSSSITSPATLYEVPSSGAGFYLVFVDLICTTAGTGGTVNATLNWNNGAASISTSTATIPLSTLGYESSQFFTVYSASSQAITYTTTVTGAAGSPRYSVRLRMIFLG